MATYSTFLGLKLNAETDPFLLQDFVNNWTLIDQSPGTYICTSLTQPNLAQDQAGLQVFMTDVKYSQWWNGTSFQDPLQSVPLFAGGSYLNTAMTRNSTYTTTILTFTTSRPASMALFLVATYNCSNQQSQDLYQSILFDGQGTWIGSYREQIRFEGNSSDASGTAGDVCTSISIAPSVAAGQHRVGIECQVGSSSTPVTLIGVKVLAFVGQYNAQNTL
jgi:hypothetical protein